MVGAAPDGQLTDRVAIPQGRARFAVAGPADDTAIRRLLRENPMRGSITLTFEREPDYFRGANIGGAEDQTIVAFGGERLLCMGRCTTRLCWLNGRVVPVAYLGELRLDHSAHGRFDILRGGYRFFRTQAAHHPAECYFTSLAADNQRARQLLERGAPGLPRYEFLSELTTLLVATKNARSSVASLEPADAAELATFFDRSASRQNFATAWSPSTLRSLAAHDLPLSGFGVWRRGGNIIAAGGLWDQRRFRQTVVRGYTGPLTLARPLLQALGPVLGLPRLPHPGSVLSHCFLSPLAVDPDHAAMLPELVAAFAQRAAHQGIDYLTLALPSDDPRITALQRRFRTRAYHSRLYRVSWSGDATLTLDPRPILPDVSLL